MELTLPSTNDMREEIGIRKKELVDILKKLENEEAIKREGSGRGAKTYLLTTVEDAHKFLKEYSPESITE